MNKRILIVDDETNVRLNFRMTLETEGYEVIEVSSGEAAVQLLGEDRFALAILDIRMPGMSGLELQKELAKKWPMVPLVLITGHGGCGKATSRITRRPLAHHRDTPPVDEYVIGAGLLARGSMLLSCLPEAAWPQ